MAFLSLPDVKYRDTFLSGLAEYHAEGRHVDMDARFIARDFEGFVRSLHARADDRRLPHGWVPSTELWLIDGDEYIGTSHVRHRLNDQLRRYGGNIGYEGGFLPIVAPGFPSGLPAIATAAVLGIALNLLFTLLRPGARRG